MCTDRNAEGKRMSPVKVTPSLRNRRAVAQGIMPLTALRELSIFMGVPRPDAYSESVLFGHHPALVSLVPPPSGTEVRVY